MGNVGCLRFLVISGKSGFGFGCPTAAITSGSIHLSRTTLSTGESSHGVYIFMSSWQEGGKINYFRVGEAGRSDI